MTWTYSAYLDALEPELARFADAIRGADLATPVPSCPPWDLAELIKHIGGIQRWAGQMVADRMTSRLSFRALDMQEPADPTGYPAWFEAGAAQLLQRLRAADPDQPTWAWGADQHGRFWGRRMLHETGLHRADAELALGRQPSFEPAVAVDGVDEFLDNLPHAAAFAPNVKDLKGMGSLHFHCTDAEGEWLIEMTPEGFNWQHGHAKGDVAVRGAASDLLLLLYGRVKPDAEGKFQIFGDEALLQRWLGSSSI